VLRYQFGWTKDHRIVLREASEHSVFYVEMVFTDQIDGPGSKSKALADELEFSSKSYKDKEAEFFGWGSVSLPGDLPFSLLP